jgi:hypothetical protein
MNSMKISTWGIGPPSTYLNSNVLVEIKSLASRLQLSVPRVGQPRALQSATIDLCSLKESACLLETLSRTIRRRVFRVCAQLSGSISMRW